MYLLRIVIIIPWTKGLGIITKELSQYYIAIFYIKGYYTVIFNIKGYITLYRLYI